MPFGTGTPKPRSSALAWYSWMFMPCPRPARHAGLLAERREEPDAGLDQPVDGGDGIVEHLALGLRQVDLDDTLDALGAEHHRHADVAVA